jgi:hypothetical protein
MKTEAELVSAQVKCLKCKYKELADNTSTVSLRRLVGGLSYLDLMYIQNF